MVRTPVRFGTLDNGLMFYAHPGGSQNLSAIGVRAGSLETPGGKVGLPHLIEHLLARNSATYTVEQVNLMIMEFCGGPGLHNIRIDRCSTLYGHDMFAWKHQMTRMFGVFANLLESVLVDADSVASEKATVRQEYFLYGKDVMEQDIEDMLAALVFKNHPAGLRIDAEIPDLKSITPADIEQFIRRYYRASNMFVTMFGPSYKEVSRLVRKTFGHWPALPEPRKRSAPQNSFSPLRQIIQQEERRRGIHQTHVAVGFRSEPHGSPDTAALDILCRIWRHKITNRLREDNRDFSSGIYRAYTYSEKTRLHGLLEASFATTSPKYADYGYEVVLEEAERLGGRLTEQDLFRAARNSALNQFQISWTNVPLDVCEMVVEATCNGDRERSGLHSYSESLRAVRREDVRRVAQKYFNHPHALAMIRPA